MTDEELIARLRARAAEERVIQKNNEAVAAALMGQRLLFEQGVHSASNSFAVRLGLEHENCAKNDAKLAQDWDAAADRIEALTAKLATCEKYRDAYAECDRIGTQTVRDLEAKLAKAVEALEEISGNGNAAGRNPQLMADIARATLAEIKGESHE